MSALIELSDEQIDAVSGGTMSSNISLQLNLNVSPQVAIGVAVLSPGAVVTAKNNLLSFQTNVRV